MNKKVLLLLFLLIVIYFMVISCEDDNFIIVNKEQSDEDEVEMLFNSEKPYFEDKTKTRSVNKSKEWIMSDTLFLVFPSGNWGIASYLPSTQKWILKMGNSNYVANMKQGTCKVFYPQGGNAYFDEEYHNYFISPQTAIFGDTVAAFKYEDSIFSLFARLQPLTSRIRFISETPTEIKIKGFESYSKIYRYDDSYMLRNCYHNLLIESRNRASQPIQISINKMDETGFYSSDYIYGNLTEQYSDFSLINLKDPNIYYIRKNQSVSNFFKQGTSGFIKIPTSDNYNGWNKNNNYIKTIANEIIFTTLYVDDTYDYPLGQVAGYGVLCNVDLSADAGWVQVKIPGGWGAMFSMANDDRNGKSYQSALSMTIPFVDSYTNNITIRFCHYYLPMGTKEKFTNAKLYYFAY